MRSTTTVTTSAHYNNRVENGVNSLPVIHPSEMLRKLIPHAQSNKENLATQKSAQQNDQSKGQLVLQIEKLQNDLNNIHAEIIESENMLNVRDTLYGQLDMLRDEREQIEADFAYFDRQQQESHVLVSQTHQQNYAEMNERLRRRILEVNDYIRKMDLENKKIEDTICVSESLNYERQLRNNSQTHNSAWVDNAYFGHDYPVRDGRHQIEDLVSRLHSKQEEALERVKRQEEDIQRRNEMNRTSFQSHQFYPRNSFNLTGALPSRSYYQQMGSTVTGAGRFYSPDYKY